MRGWVRSRRFRIARADALPRSSSQQRRSRLRAASAHIAIAKGGEASRDQRRMGSATSARSAPDRCRVSY
jgi:hypothetical protein